MWRSTLETKGVLVFQASRIDVAEMRGVSLNLRPLPIVLINGADAPNARVFSMAHELVHLALDRGSLCDLDDDPRRPPEDLKLEVFCNRVAGAVLLPAAWLLSHQVVAAHSGMAWHDEDIGALARHFGVSREVVLRRLLIHGRTTEAVYRRKRSEYLREFLKKKEEQVGFAPPHTMAISRAGNLFVRLVLESYYKERITSANVSEFLDVKLKHLSNIELSLSVRSAAGV
jgi:Zn-dependent peptidase ImmA (M78 family)